MPTMNLDTIVKDPLVRGPLAVYPLFSTAPSTPNYLTGPEAERLGVLRVAETPGGATVPELTVHNTGALALLLLEGETIVGAKQNRTLDLSLLVAPGTVLEVPVSCVEAGRWGPPRASTRSHRHAPTDLRRVKTSTLAAPGRHAPTKQAAVWARIDQYQDELAAPSATSALEDAFAVRAHDVMELVEGARPLPEQRGVAVAVRGVVRGLDWFDKAETLAAYWDGLTAGYALDAVGAPGATTPDAPHTEVPSIAAVRTLVEQVESAAHSPVASPGLGRSTTFAADGLVGHTLAWGEAFVHVSAFVDEDVVAGPSAGPRTRARPIVRTPQRRS